jgi:hypothetical protein
MIKSCAAHGRFEVTLARDPRFYHPGQGGREADRCGEECACAAGPAGSRNPFDVLSTCTAIIDIVDSCNLACPACYAASPFGIDRHVDCIGFEEFVRRVQGVIDRKGSLDIVQLSGGEPTIHPEFFRILEWSVRHPSIGYVLVNTNGVRIASDADFRNRLAALRGSVGRFELYHQFDGPQREGQAHLRGADLRAVRRRSIDGAGLLGVPTTLAMVVTPVTIHFLGAALRFGLRRPHCRGICFQPMFASGRVPRIEGALRAAPPEGGGDSCRRSEPISVGDVAHQVVRQSRGVLRDEDFTPLPCGDPNCHTIAYLLRRDQGPVGISRLVDLRSLQGFLRNRLAYTLTDLARCGCEAEPLGWLLKSLETGPDRPFRVFIKPFMDAWTYDQDRIDRCCTHVIRPDGELDSFCRYYLEGGAARLRIDRAVG